MVETSLVQIGHVATPSASRRSAAGADSLPILLIAHFSSSGHRSEMGDHAQVPGIEGVILIVEITYELQREPQAAVVRELHADAEGLVANNVGEGDTARIQDHARAVQETTQHEEGPVFERRVGAHEGAVQ